MIVNKYKIIDQLAMKIKGLCALHDKICDEYLENSIYKIRNLVKFSSGFNVFVGEIQGVHIDFKKKKGSFLYHIYCGSSGKFFYDVKENDIKRRLSHALPKKDKKA